VKEYEGRRCLELLRQWQEEDATAEVVDFLYSKLDMLPVAELTRQFQRVQRQSQDDGLARRLAHGRLVMLNRGMNLLQALEAIFVLSEEKLLQEVQAACARYGHLAAQIEQQLAEMDSPLYAYVPHQLLAQRNMLVMNALGVSGADSPVDGPAHRSWRVVQPTEPLRPFAEHVVEGYQELVSPSHNNPRGERFVDRSERDETSSR
jgi:hypothetical protein